MAADPGRFSPGGQLREKDDLINLLISVKRAGLKAGLSEAEIKSAVELKLRQLKCNKQKWSFREKLLFIFIFVAIICAVALQNKDFLSSRCGIENNYIVMEITRPITDCRICKGIRKFRILRNVTREEFAQYAYLGQPMLVKGGCQNWTALNVFSYDFFKQLYNEIPGAYQSVEEECQFFPFKTEFLQLDDVFKMPESRAKMLSPDEKTWYIGWSNCNPDVAAVLRKHYSRPHFLPEDSELSAIDWIFMGYKGQGASMHLDYVQRPSWQAQIAGSKTWYLLPPPECEKECHSMNVTVQKGDIILIDTNQWYHTTFIEGSEMSITLGSEYD